MKTQHKILKLSQKNGYMSNTKSLQKIKEQFGKKAYSDIKSFLNYYDGEVREIVINPSGPNLENIGSSDSKLVGFKVDGELSMKDIQLGGFSFDHPARTLQSYNNIDVDLVVDVG